MAWEFAVLDYLQQLHTTIGDFFFSTITHLGDAGIAWILFSLFLLCTKKYRKCGAAMALSLIFGLIIGNITLKPLVARIRPYDINTAVDVLITKPTDFSFPSGHTLASFDCSLALLHYNKKLGVPAVIVAAFVAFSRLYLYIHYPTDVLAGIAIGAVCAYAACKVIDSAEKKDEKFAKFINR